MSHNKASTMDLVTKAMAELSTDEQKAQAGNKSAAVRARKQCMSISRLLKALRIELMELT